MEPKVTKKMAAFLNTLLLQHQAQQIVKENDDLCKSITLVVDVARERGFNAGLDSGYEAGYNQADIRRD